MTRLVRGVLAIAAFVGAIAGVAAFAREPVEHAARLAVEAGGLWGLGVAVFVGDPIPGVGFGVALMVGYAGGVAPATLFVVLSLGSLVSSVATWAVGRALATAAWLPALLERWKVAPLLRAHGARAIAVAAVSPVPWGLATLGAGASGVRLGPLVAGAAFRPLKIAVTIAAFALGWSS